jgi:hypothetical protein
VQPKMASRDTCNARRSTSSISGVAGDAIIVAA